jgi:hypothetical protein
VSASAPALDAYFDAALKVFARAATGQGGAAIRDYSLAGHGLRVHFAGQALAASLGLTLTRRPIPSAAPALTVYAWGGEMPGGQLPPPPWESVNYFERGNTRGVHTRAHSLVYDRRADVFSAVDHNRAIGVYWMRDAGEISYLERAAPLRRVLQSWAQQRGMFVAHAAGVGRPTGGVLLAGRTGSGKSTTAIACLRSDLGYAGDDCVLVAAEPRPSLHGLYITAKLNAALLDWLPEVAPLVANPDRLNEEKALLRLDPAWKHKLIEAFPLRAIVAPRPTQAAVSVARPLAPEAAYKAIVPDMLFTALGEGRVVAQVMGRLVRELPCYELLLGTDLDTVPAAINRILEAHAA